MPANIGHTQIVKHPLLSEKSTYAMNEHGRYSFVVDVRATKTEIKAAIEGFYGADPETSTSFPRIISVEHAKRLEKTFKDGTVIHGGGGTRRSPPRATGTVVVAATLSSQGT